MRIMIVGAGGVGGYLGTRFINTKAEVNLIARGEHLKEIQKNGLKLIEDKNISTFYPSSASDKPSNLGVQDLIFITIKEPDLENALKSIKNNVSDNTYIIPLLNGVDYRSRILKYYPNANVLEGCIYIISNIVQAGIIEKKGSIFQLCWGEDDFNNYKYSDLIELFNSSLPRHRATANIRYEQWKKFLFISPMAGLTSVYQISMDRVFKEHKDEFYNLLKEIVAVANSKQIPLGEKEIEATLNQASKVIKKAKTSMQLDLERDKVAEIEALIGYITKEGKKRDIDTNGMNLVYKLLKDRYTNQKG